MNTPKITFIGGGSYQWVPTLFRDIAVNPTLDGSTFVLHDTHPGRNGELTEVCQIIARKLDSNIAVVQEDDLAEALKGADIVILCISTGGLDAMEPDIEIPKKYGVYQPVGDSTGPGGISRTLRNVPVVAELATQMEIFCPNAWLLNLSNPMGQIVQAVHRTSQIKVVGLCHEYMSFMGKVQNILGLQDWRKETSATIAGVNHFAWLTQLDVNGEDGLELLRERIQGGDAASAEAKENLVNFSETLSADQVKFALFQEYGAVPYPGDRHVVEFMPYFLTPSSRHGEEYGVHLTSINDRRTIWLDGFRKKIAEWTSEDPALPPREPSDESLAPIIAALVGGEPTIQPVTIPNDGQISNLPLGSSVETLATFTRGQMAPHVSGPISQDLLTLVHKHCLIQDLAVEGAIEGDYGKVLRAMIADPLNSHVEYRDLGKMLNEMMAANRQWLPQFEEHFRATIPRETPAPALRETREPAQV